MTTEIVEYSKTEAALTDLAQKYKGVIFAVTTKDGMKSATEARAELRGYRVALEKTRVEIKAPALRRTQQIDSEARRITAAISALEDPIDEQIQVVARAAKRAEEEKLRLEAERIAAEDKARKDAEEAKLAAERAEIAKQRAALEEAERESRRKIEEAERTSRMKMEEEARQERLASQAREEVERVRRRAEEERLKAERDRLDAERRAAEEVQREIQRKKAQSLDGRAALSDFTHRFGSLPEFATITKSIYEFLEAS